jgi:hypothetical protein
LIAKITVDEFPPGVGGVGPVVPPVVVSSLEQAAIMHATQVKAMLPPILLKNSFLSIRLIFLITS